MGPRLLAAMALLAAQAVGATLHIQVVNRTKEDVIEVSLDGRKIYGIKPKARPDRDSNAIPDTVGTYTVAKGSDHNLLVEVPAGRARAQLHWNAGSDKQWIVIYWTPPRDSAKASGTITFSVQHGPAAAK